jgi:HK97 family phage major capsid protein
MSDKLKELREKRGKAIADMRALIAKAETEKRDMGADELAQHAALFAESERCRGLIEAEERTAEAERQAAAGDAAAAEARRRAEAEGRQPGADSETEKRRMTAFRSWLRTGTIAGDGAAELRALQAGTDTEGGFIVAPQQFVADLIKFVDNIVFMRSKARTLKVTGAQSLGVPSLDADIDDADWTSELATGNEDTGMKFGKREFFPHPLAKRIKVSKKLLRVAVLPIEQLVMQRMGYKFGVSQEKAYMIGSGRQQPLGVFTASNDGIPAGQDVSTGNTNASMTFDGLINAKMSLKSQYWNKGEWIFHRDAISQLLKLKDGEGRYIWQQSIAADKPDTLLQRPINISEYAPNTFTTGKYVGLFGDLSFYWIVDALDMQVQRLTELYAETNQDGFIGRLESDGMPVLAEAFARVKLA